MATPIPAKASISVSLPPSPKAMLFFPHKTQMIERFLQAVHLAAGCGQDIDKFFAPAHSAAAGHVSHELRFLLAAQKCAELIRRVGKAALGRIDGFLRISFKKFSHRALVRVHVSGIRFHKGNRNICFFQPGQQLAQSLLRQR